MISGVQSRQTDGGDARQISVTMTADGGDGGDGGDARWFCP